MKKKLQQLIDWINGLTLRERGMVLAAMLFVIYSVWANALLDPLTAKQKRITAQLQETQQQIAALQLQEQTVLSGGEVDPDAANKARLTQLRQQLAGLDEQLKKVTIGLIEPTQMLKVLQEVLTREPDLKLIRVKNLEAVPLTPAGQSGAAAYKHGLVLEFEGGYLSTYNYLKELEALPWQLFWDSLELKVEKFPKARVTITVHTLSLKEGWLGV
ncbi:MAG: hypothetical protein AB1469_00355 [Pseudomonadota bacterium]